MKSFKTSIPEDSLTQQFIPTDYTDAFACEAVDAENISADNVMIEFWTVMPGWVNALFKLRNVLVRPFGLKTDNERDKTEGLKNTIRNGGSFGLASLAAKSENETVLLLSDKHLDAYMSVHLSRKGNSRIVTAITVVHYHNSLGKTYFLFIRPFHKVIVKSMLKSTLKRMLRNK